MLSSHPCVFPNGLVVSGLPIKILYTFLIFPASVTCPAHQIFHYWSP